MGCPSEVEIGKDLKFSICCHDPDTGVLTDADAAPSYRVYEDENVTPILTGTMAKLDDVNTTGFYTEIITCSVGNGFENGKTYTVYIEATVDSDTGGISYEFKAYDVRKADVIRISGSPDAADRLKASAETIIPATVNDAGATTTVFITDLSSVVDDFYNGRIIIFTDGALAYQATAIEDYDGATKTVTVTALTAAPANGVGFVVV